ncbi:MAG: chorismate synthase [Candidatus Korarchaeum sp.]|nr:chorismate synthase [Candidatus Korarchaeum sp.]
MGGDVFGRELRLISFGESHGEVVGVVVEGVPAGLQLSEDYLQRILDLRKPAQSHLSSQRAEEDRVEVLSGVFKGYTTGAPICMIVRNLDVDSSYYEEFRRIPRPGHADYVATVKYGGYGDYRGGGRFSGRMTVSMCMGGAVAMRILERLGVEIIAYSLEIGGERARDFTLEEAKSYRYLNPMRAPNEESYHRMTRAVEDAMRDGDSVGGIVEAVALNVPPGLGEPIFDTIEGDVAKAMFSIPGVKGVEFGSGFRATAMRGSEHNDPMRVIDGKVKYVKNDHGGVIGGITTGEPLVLRVAFKPTPSIAKPQDSVDLELLRDVRIKIKGRHDPCIVPRAVVVVESMLAFTLADHAIRYGLVPRVLR